MKRKVLIGASAALCLIAAANAANAGDGDWKRGRVYYRMVCTACHEKSGGSIAPNTRTKAEWSAYLQADKHAKAKDTVRYYVGKQYRASAKATNKAAEKFLEVPEQDLYDDVRSFMTRGAKDGDAPASCS